MLKRYYPGGYASSVFAIDFEKLYQRGYRGILFDVDNTLVHHGDDSNPQVDALFCRLHEMGFKTLLLSNNNARRLERFNENIQTRYIPLANKPAPDAYEQAVEMLGLTKGETLCIGDQLFTDILGANRSGIDSILVQFIQVDPKAKIGIRRHVERWILRFYRRSARCQRLGDIQRTGEE
ncbi:MAG: YqeG family HAD IIIA-type phosphatase [Oscillospiraceae bacterium]|nr:YqeG family HAD IIIA-type phosphatase [Oscillospiraceae bacterium]